MNKAIICLGSNVDNAVEMISKAVDALIVHGCIVTSHSEIYQVSEPYYNFVVRLECDDDYEALVAATKDIERRLGRAPQMKASGIVPIDIDVVVFNNEIKRRRDFDAPYFRPGFYESS